MSSPSRETTLLHQIVKLHRRVNAQELARAEAVFLLKLLHLKNGVPLDIALLCLYTLKHILSECYILSPKPCSRGPWLRLNLTPHPLNPELLNPQPRLQSPSWRH